MRTLLNARCSLLVMYLIYCLGECCLHNVHTSCSGCDTRGECICKNDENAYIARIDYEGGEDGGNTNWQLQASSEPFNLSVSITSEKRSVVFCASSGTYFVNGEGSGVLEIFDNTTRETRSYGVPTRNFTLPFCLSGHFCPTNGTRIRCDSLTCPGVTCQPGKYGNTTTGCISCPVGKYGEIKFKSYYYNRSPYKKCPISINSFHDCEAAAQDLFAPDNFIAIKDDVMIKHQRSSYNTITDYENGIRVTFQINRSTYPRGCYLRKLDSDYSFEDILAYNKDNQNDGTCLNAYYDRSSNANDRWGYSRSDLSYECQELCAHNWGGDPCPYTKTTCPAGHYCMNNENVPRACPLGKFGNEIGQQTEANACSGNCPQGKFGRLSGQTNEIHACACNAGTWGVLECMKCSFPNICTGGKNCTYGREGIACSECLRCDRNKTLFGSACQSWFSPDGGKTCVPCPENDLAPLLTGVFGIAFAFSGIYGLLSNSKGYDPNVEDESAKKNDNNEIRRSHTKSEFESGAEGYEERETNNTTGISNTTGAMVGIFTAHAIILSFQLPTFDLLHLPPEFRYWLMYIMKIFTINITGLLTSPECSMDMNVLDRYWIKMCLPLILLYFISLWRFAVAVKIPLKLAMIEAPFIVGSFLPIAYPDTFWVAIPCWVFLLLFAPALKVILVEKEKNLDHSFRSVDNHIVGVFSYVWITTLYAWTFRDIMTIFDCTSQGDGMQTLDINPSIACGRDYQHIITTYVSIFVVIPFYVIYGLPRIEFFEQLMITYSYDKEDEEYFSRSYLPFWFVALILHPIIFATNAIAFALIVVVKILVTLFAVDSSIHVEPILKGLDRQQEKENWAPISCCKMIRTLGTGKFISDEGRFGARVLESFFLLLLRDILNTPMFFFMCFIDNPYLEEIRLDESSREVPAVINGCINFLTLGDRFVVNYDGLQKFWISDVPLFCIIPNYLMNMFLLVMWYGTWLAGLYVYNVDTFFDDRESSEGDRIWLLPLLIPGAIRYSFLAIPNAFMIAFGAVVNCLLLPFTLWTRLKNTNVELKYIWDIKRCLHYNEATQRHCNNCWFCDMHERYSWIIEKYHPNCYYWEIVILARKLLIIFPGLFLTNRYIESFSLQIIINAVFFMLTIKYQPYLTDKEFFEYARHERAVTSNKKWSMARMGINTLLDALLMFAEILMTIGALITRVSQDQLSKPVGNSRLETLNQLSTEFPIMTAVGAICEFAGVTLFMLGFLYCVIEVSLWSYKSYQYKQKQKERDKKNRKVKILPTDATKQNSAQILRKESTELI